MSCDYFRNCFLLTLDLVKVKPKKDIFIPIQTTKLNSVKDNKKFEINAVEILYSLPINSFTLINDDKDNIYLAKVKKYEKQSIDINSDEFDEYIKKENSNNKNTLLKSYDLLLNNKYEVTLYQKTIDRVKYNFK